MDWRLDLSLARSKALVRDYTDIRHGIIEPRFAAKHKSKADCWGYAAQMGVGLLCCAILLVSGKAIGLPIGSIGDQSQSDSPTITCALVNIIYTQLCMCGIGGPIAMLGQR